MRGRSSVLIIGLLGLSGCIDLSGVNGECNVPGAPPTRMFGSPGPMGEPTDPRQPWDTLLLHATSPNLTVSRIEAPPGWMVTQGPVPNPGGGPAMHWVRAAPLPNADEGRLVLAGDAAEFDRPGCELVQEFRQEVRFARPLAGVTVEPGESANVLTAGFWKNGTLFYTNMPAVEAARDIPRAGWYQFDASGPLPVYVYDRDRSERPVQWSVGAPDVPVIGGPLYLWNYRTTIEGFNDALKGLSTATSRVVQIPAEKAYTRPGLETHPLYGDDLVFHITILDVVDLPCPRPLSPPRCQLTA